jgi:hypothetical protein
VICRYLPHSVFRSSTTLLFRDVMEVSLYRNDWSNHWPPILSLSVLSPETWWGAKSSNPLVMGWSFWWPAPSLSYLRTHWKSPSELNQHDGKAQVIDNKRCSNHSHHSEDPKTFGALDQELGTNTKLYFPLCHRTEQNKSHLGTLATNIIFHLRAECQSWQSSRAPA